MTSNESSPAIKRGRRPLEYSVPSEKRPFASSAAKRNSVLALGSINHLQHYFVKEARRSAGPRSSSLPSSAKKLPGIHVPSDDLLLEEDEDEVLPPSPSPPPQRTEAWLNDKPASLRELRQDCYTHLDQVCQAWRIVDAPSQRRLSSSAAASVATSPDLASLRSMTSSPDPLSLPSVNSDSDDSSLILELMQVTTDAIRAVQKLALALPSDELSMAHLSLSTLDSPLSARHQSHMGISTASRPRTSLGLPAPSASGASKRATPGSTSPTPGFSASEEPDALARIRKASLDILALLRDLDEKYKLPTSSPDPSFTPLPEPSDASTSNGSEASDPASILKGHLYQDVKLDTLSTEKEQVCKWIETVDIVLFASLKKNPSAAASESPADMSNPLLVLPPEEIAQLDTHLPDWAKEAAFPNDALRRAHACIAANLPTSLLFNLEIPGGSSDGRQAFLDSLADGQLLCIAYNAAVRQSERPFGFIQPDSIHDLIALLAAQSKSATDPEDPPRREPSEGAPSSIQQKVGLTFRRLENLQVWVASLRLRYGILLGASAIGARQRGSSKEAQVDPQALAFDVKKLARKETGWQEMLEFAVFRWVDAVVDEKRHAQS